MFYFLIIFKFKRTLEIILKIDHLSIFRLRKQSFLNLKRFTFKNWYKIGLQIGLHLKTRLAGKHASQSLIVRYAISASENALDNGRNRLTVFVQFDNSRFVSVRSYAIRLLKAYYSFFLNFISIPKRYLDS